MSNYNYPTGKKSYTSIGGGTAYPTGSTAYPTGSNSYNGSNAYPTGSNAYPSAAAAANNMYTNSNQGTPTPLSDFNAHLTNIDEFLGHYPWILQAEQKTGIRRAYLMLITLGCMSLLVLWSHGSDALCNLVGFVYPMYASFKALKTEVKDDDTEWLTYWVVYGFCTLVEDFCNSIFEASSWSSIYFCAKIVFLVWLYLPQTKGANMVYKTVVEPILSKYEAQIDRDVDATMKGGQQIVNELGTDPHVQNAINRAVVTAAAHAQSVNVYGYDTTGTPYKVN